MATLYLRTGTGVSSWKIQKSTSTTKTTISGSATISNAGNSTYIIYASDVTCADGYAKPVGVYTSSKGTSWTYKDYLQSSSVSISVGSDDLYVRVGPATEVSPATLTVNYSSPLTAVYLNETKYTSGFTYSSGVEFTGLEFAPGSSWSGTVYWGKSSGATTYKIATVKSSVVTMAATQETIDYTGSARTIYVTLVGETEYDTYNLYFRTGTGIQSYKLRYDGAKSSTENQTATISSRTSSSPLAVRAGTNATLTEFTPESGCEDFFFREYTDSTFSTPKSGGDFDIGDANVYSGGSRSLRLFGLYRCYFYAEEGDSSAAYAVSVKPGGSLSLSTASNEVSKAGYTLIGWKDAEDGTVYKTTASIAEIWSSKRLYAVWQKSVATITLDGNGGAWGAVVTKIATKDVGDVLLFSEYSEGLTRTGYVLLGWSANQAATAATYGTGGYVSVGATNATYYAVWKKGIDLFYWDSESTDAALIAKGQPVTNLTAARWNKLLAKIKEVAEAQGGSFSYGEVSSGGTFYASEFNEARTGILALTGHGTLPGTKASDDDVLASLFEGSGSLKSALNTAITNFNNS